MKTQAAAILFVIVSALVGVLWGWQRRITLQLENELADLRRTHSALARAQTEHNRLVQQSVDASRTFTRSADEAKDAPTVDQPAPQPERVAEPVLPPGEWVAMDVLRNVGRNSPQAAVQSMLWAASGGDLEALKSMLEFDPLSLTKAAEAHARLSDSLRQTYATPRDLLALVIAGNIPLESVQWVALQRLAIDQATAFVRLKDSEGATRQVHLSVHHAEDGWRLRVPANVVDRIVASLPSIQQ